MAIGMKEITFRGKSIAELQALSVEDFAKLCTSRARRTLVKTGVDKKMLKKIENQKKNGAKSKPIRTQRRDWVIVPAMVGARFAIHKGKEYENVEVSLRMLGHYLGEYALTRKRLMHGKAGIGATKSSTAVTARG